MMCSFQNLLFLTLVVTAFSELVDWKPCYYSGESGKHCTIKNLNIDPCPEAATHEPCRVKRGEQSRITFNYTIDFEPTETVKTHAYWMAPYADVPWNDMDTNICKPSKCPVLKDVDNTYDYTLDVLRTYPAQRFNIKWRIWEEKKGRDRECCFIFKIKLV